MTDLGQSSARLLVGRRSPQLSYDGSVRARTKSSAYVEAPSNDRSTRGICSSSIRTERRCRGSAWSVSTQHVCPNFSRPSIHWLALVRRVTFPDRRQPPASPSLSKLHTSFYFLQRVMSFPWNYDLQLEHLHAAHLQSAPQLHPSPGLAQLVSAMSGDVVGGHVVTRSWKRDGTKLETRWWRGRDEVS